jgi:hypothetical protein
MPLHRNFERDRLLFPASDAVQSALGEINVLEIVEVFEDSFADVEGFGASSAPGELLRRFSIDWGRRIASMVAPLYKYSGGQLKVESQE